MRGHLEARTKQIVFYNKPKIIYNYLYVCPYHCKPLMRRIQIDHNFQFPSIEAGEDLSLGFGNDDNEL